MRKILIFLKASVICSLIFASISLSCTESFVTDPSGLKYHDKKSGSGNSPKEGDLVVVHYTGTLEENGQKFDSSRDRGRPFTFALGKGQVIRGWDIGVASMKRGGVRILVIPSDLAYGARGAPPAIPPDATLRFEVELLEIKAAPVQWSNNGLPVRTHPSGLKYFMFNEGKGARASAGKTVTVHYSGYLESGTLFDSSHLRSEPFVFRLGQREVIPGWDIGVALMRIGSKYKFIIPSNLGYGSQGNGPIPPNTTIVFDVELLDINN